MTLISISTPSESGHGSTGIEGCRERSGLTHCKGCGRYILIPAFRNLSPFFARNNKDPLKTIMASRNYSEIQISSIEFYGLKPLNMKQIIYTIEGLRKESRERVCVCV